MKLVSNQLLLITSAILLIALLYLLGPILTPFLLGALFAYLVDPLVKQLEKRRVPHLLSVVLIFSLLFSTLISIILLLYPLVYKQIESLIGVLPVIVEWIQKIGVPWVLQLVNLNSLKNSIPAALSKTGWMVSTVINSSMAAIQIILSIVLTPIVTFYLLRDWDKVINGIKSLLPKDSAASIIQLAKDCDEVLSAFLRGQLLVMLCLGIIYGIGLSIIGLKFGLLIGLLGGLLSLVPFLGSLFVVITGMISAITQFGTFEPAAYVGVVFLVGQTIESYFLTPYLIGERIGLHPVAIIFSVMAFGSLFGFFGVLLALPVSAVLMAVFRFFRKRAHG